MSIKYSESHIAELTSDVCRAITTPYSGIRLAVHHEKIFYTTHIKYRLMFTGKDVNACSIHDIYDSLVNLFSKHSDVSLCNPYYDDASPDDSRYGFILANIEYDGSPCGDINLQYYGLTDPSIIISTTHYLAGIGYSIEKIIEDESNYIILLDGKISLNLE